MRRRVNDKSFKRVRKNKTVTLGATSSISFTATPKQDPLNPRTQRLSSVRVIRGNAGGMFFVTLRDEENWRSLKEDAALASFMDWDNTSRAHFIKVLEAWGSAPSAIFSRLLNYAVTSRQVGQIRRYHLPSWRKMGNQHIKNVLGINRIIV